jgi:hypothetical protein
VTALRVLQVDAGREWRGGQNQVRLLCRALHRTSDVQVRLLTRGAGDLARRAGADGVHVRGAPWTAGLDPRALLSLWAEWRAFAPHIVHAHDSHALRLALWARLLGARSACVVATRRVDFPVRRGGIWSRVDRVIAISHAVRAVLAAGGLAPADVPVVPSGIDPDEVRRAAATPFGARRRLGLPEASPLVAVISLAGIVYSKAIRVAGNEMDEAIIQYIKKTYNLLIGERTAEQIKMQLGSAFPLEDRLTMEIKGRHLIEGVPKTLTISDEEVREALAETVNVIVDAVHVALEATPPELSADIVDRGIVVTGGGALLKNLDKRLREETGLPVAMAEDPLSTVVRGAGKMLSNFELLRKISLD